MKVQTKSLRPASLSAAEISAEVGRIGAMSIAQVRAEYVAVCKSSPAAGLSKDVMARELAYCLQERVLGGLSQDIRRLLRSIEKGDGPVRQIKLGSLIVREYQGVLHEVTVVPGGFAWRGRTYAALSTIARLITGTSWNGPRFFGLRTKQRAERGLEASEAEAENQATVRRRRGRRSSVGASLDYASSYSASAERADGGDDTRGGS